VVSALLNLPVRNDLAMTGEITLRGRVLPIGGLREKLLAAHRGRIRTVIIPEENEKDLKEVPEAIMKDLEIIRVEHMDQVLENALVCADPDKLFCGRGEGHPPPFRVAYEGRLPAADPPLGRGRTPQKYDGRPSRTEVRPFCRFFPGRNPDRTGAFPRSHKAWRERA
jgi:hypothetical protein